MDREDKRLKEIDTAAENFIAFDLRDTSFPAEDQEFFMSCFGAGAQWADRNPQSPWISVEEDLPYNHEELKTAKYETEEVFILDSFGNLDTDYMLKENGKWKWFSYSSVKFWFPVPELPKE